MNEKIKMNAEYSAREIAQLDATLKLIIKRADRALGYGPNMPSSKHSLVMDIKALCESVIDDGSVKL